MGDDFSRELINRLNHAQRHPGPNVARLIYIESKPVRRHLRSVASARTSITEATWLIVGLAYLHPERLMESNTQGADSALERSRLIRTFQNDQARTCWCMVHATRSMTAVESVAMHFGCEVDWILEGLDREKVSAMLAIPDDHLILGFFAISRTADSDATLNFPHLPGMDYNGFGGNWPIVQQDSGPQAG